MADTGTGNFPESVPDPKSKLVIMNRFCKLLPIAVISLGIASCDHTLDCPTVTFDAVLLSEDIHAGDSVIFSTSGHADYLTFWSGEQGSDYDFRYGRTLVPDWEYYLSFTTKIVKGVQTGQLSLLVSDSFDGDYSDYDNIIHTEWTDITGRFSWAVSGDAVSSSSQSITEFVTEDTPVWFAFRYRTRPQSEFGQASNWLISEWNITNISEEMGPVTMYDNSNSGFRVIDPFARTPVASSATVSSSQIAVAGYDPASTSEDVETDLWVISRPLRLTDAIEMGPDTPLSVKNFSKQDVSGFGYVYENPGIYEAVFVASNQTIRDKKEVVRTIRITVNE